jgi:hypothetical protein
MNFSRGFAWFPLLFGIILALGVSGGAYWYVHQMPGQPLSIDVNSIPIGTSTSNVNQNTQLTLSPGNGEAAHYDQEYNQPFTMRLGQTATNAIDAKAYQYDSITLDSINGSTATITYVLRSVTCGLHCGSPLPMAYSTSTHTLLLNQAVCVGWTDSNNGMYLTLTNVQGSNATFTFSSAGSSDCNKKGDQTATETKAYLSN